MEQCLGVPYSYHVELQVTEAKEQLKEAKEQVEVMQITCAALDQKQQQTNLQVCSSEQILESGSVSSRVVCTVLLSQYAENWRLCTEFAPGSSEQAQSLSNQLV